MFVVRKSTHNPLLKPVLDHSWESFAAFNWCPIQDKNKIHALYRAESDTQYVHKKELRISSVGHVQSKDGHHYEKRKQFIFPEYEWEQFGCEDPRVTKIDDTYYIFYTALSVFPFAAEGIKIAVATTKDFKKIISKHLVTPFNAKAMVLFPEKINGKYVAMLSAHTDAPPVITALAEFDSLEEIWSPAYWEKWHREIESHRIVLRRGESDHVEIGSAPIKTKDGWLLIYSHIQNYFSDNKIFGIEALLLDLKDPTKVVARTSGPLLVPEETYEEFGQVPNVIFPSGAFVAGKKLFIYYGATDTTCCRASVNLEDLLRSIKRQPVFTRSQQNPILLPLENHAWENKAVFNPAAVELKGKIYIVYRAMGSEDTSVMGLAISKNGKDILERLEGPIYGPREAFEMKSHPGNSGCEDPRLTQIEDTLHLFYTAYDGVNPPVVAAASISLKDFAKRQWQNWTQPTIITPVGIDNKDACLFPEKIKGRHFVFHRAHNHICLDPVKAEVCIAPALHHFFKAQVGCHQPLPGHARDDEGNRHGVQVDRAQEPFRAHFLIQKDGQRQTDYGGGTDVQPGEDAEVLDCDDPARCVPQPLVLQQADKVVQVGKHLRSCKGQDHGEEDESVDAHQDEEEARRQCHLRHVPVKPSAKG